MESPNSKRHKSSEDQDMISNLPDFIIGHILSFLPTKDAVCTSVLSKKWTYLWTFITDLHFDDHTGCYSSSIKRKDLFLSFVYRVLLYLNSSSIQSFSLTISNQYEPCHVDQWISVVLSRRVKKLCVNSKNKLALSTHSIMKYKSLEKLVLNVYSCNISVPPFAYFPSLTDLHLCGINFIGGTSNDSGNIHLDFPLLRTYKTTNCSWSSSVVTLKVPRLNVVSIKDFRRRSPSNDSHTAIKFCASGLRKFIYEGFLLPDNIVFDLSAAIIASAIIDIHWYRYEEENVQEAVALSSKLLKQFKKVISLKFQRSKKIPLAKDSLDDLPTFEKLSHLELGKVTSEILLALLQKTPNLKTLIFPELLQVDQEMLNYDRVPYCFLTTLQVIKILSFDGSELQLTFAEFVMTNAVTLKRMSFIPTPELLNSNLEEVKEKLFSFKKCDSLILEFSIVL